MNEKLLYSLSGLDVEFEVKINPFYAKMVFFLLNWPRGLLEWMNSQGSTGFHQHHLSALFLDILFLFLTFNPASS